LADKKIKNGEWNEFDEWRCGVELRTPNGEEFFETRMTMNKHEFFMNKFMDNSWIFVDISV